MNESSKDNPCQRISVSRTDSAESEASASLSDS